MKKRLVQLAVNRITAGTHTGRCGAVLYDAKHVFIQQTANYCGNHVFRNGVPRKLSIALLKDSLQQQCRVDLPSFCFTAF